MFSKSLEVLDTVKLNFNESGLQVMNIAIAFIMFGVALNMKFDGFKALMKKPKSLIVGFFSQIVLLPLVTFLLVLLLKPSPGIAFGMLLVAVCPGGNISNFISSLSKGNIELSVSLTAITTLTAIFITPFNFAFWGSLYAETSPLFCPISIDALQMLETVAVLLGIPLLLGIAFSRKFPEFTGKILKPVRVFSIVLFVGFIVVAFVGNFSNFVKYIGLIIFIVFIHNAVAFLSGWLFSKTMRLPKNDCRTITIETGIQNSGLALALIFNPNIFPQNLQLGGMAFIAAWWGVWHIIAGLCLSIFWNFKDNRKKNV